MTLAGKGLADIFSSPEDSLKQKDNDIRMRDLQKQEFLREQQQEL